MSQTKNPFETESAKIAAPDWQPIETAPRTLNLNTETLDFLGWCPDPTAPHGGDRRIIWWEPKIKKWWGDRDIEEQPTHWQPLPTPPQPENI